MNSNRLKRMIAGAGLAMALLLGGGIFAQATAQAGVRTAVAFDRHDDREKGYRDGLDRGREDARDHRSYNPNNSDHFRDGNRWYKEGFRRGYAEGYGRRMRRRY